MTSGSPLVTMFAAPKPFRGATAWDQERAIESWVRLGPDCEILLIGDEYGTQDTAKIYGATSLPHVDRNEYGTPLVDSIFHEAERAARGRVLCYVNADILLTEGFLRAVRAVPFEQFLMVGRRWDLDPQWVPELSEPDWESQLRIRVAEKGCLRLPDAIDYFVFSRNLWPAIPPFALGRTRWDNWLIYSARAQRIPIIDATPTVMAVHQNHDYSHHRQGTDGVWKGPEAARNVLLAGGSDKARFFVTDATWLLEGSTLKRPPWRLRAQRFIDTGAALHPRAAALFHATMALVRIKRSALTRLGMNVAASPSSVHNLTGQGQ